MRPRIDLCHIVGRGMHSSVGSRTDTHTHTNVSCIQLRTLVALRDESSREPASSFAASFLALHEPVVIWVVKRWSGLS